MRVPATCALLLAAVVLAVSSACSGPDDSVGSGIPHVRDVEGLDTTAVALAGVVRVTGRGCFTLDVTSPADRAATGAWIVWPDAAVQDDDTVRLRDEAAFTDGSRLSGTGTVLTLGDLPGGADQDGVIGSTGRFCGADEAGVVVLESIDGA